MNYTYDAWVEGNVLIVGRTECRKTTFVQNLGKYKMFGKIKEVIWVSKIPISKDREKNIRECFLVEEMDFKYPNNIDEFDYLIHFKDKEYLVAKNLLVKIQNSIDLLLWTISRALLTSQKHLLIFFNCI